MSYDIFGTFLGAALLLGVWLLCQRYWRGQAIACATRWATQRHLSVVDWSLAAFQMHRQTPSITFVGSSPGAQSVDVKLRLRIPVWDAWQVDEVAYCLPKGTTEDDAKPFPG